jgi:hypothetical protein
MEHDCVNDGLEYPLPACALERRKSPRYPCCTEVVCYPVGAPRSAAWTVSVQNISDTGIGFLLDQPLARGTLLVLELPPTESDPSYVVCARVVHAGPHLEGRFLIGCALQSELRPEVLQAMALTGGGSPT